MKTGLSAEEIEQLKCHLDRMKTHNKLAAEMNELLKGQRKRWPDKKTLDKAMRGGSDLYTESVKTIRWCLASTEDKYHLQKHSTRYTGSILKEKLRDESMGAGAFKSALLAAAKPPTVSLKALEVQGLLLPKRIAFVNHTGQWLKPILRKLLQHPQGLTVEVYVCDPLQAFRTPGGTVETVEVLGVLEFLWSLPTALQLHRANRNSQLNIYTYDGSRHDRRLAYFEGDLVARSDHLPPMPDRKMVRGHPGTEDGTRCILGAETVDVILRGHPGFEEASAEIRSYLADESGKGSLPGLNPGGPLISWSAKGFSGIKCPSGNGKFDMSPSLYLCPRPAETAPTSMSAELKPSRNAPTRLGQ